jgi:hypothetical protein
MQLGRYRKPFFILIFILAGLFILAGWGVGYLVRYSATNPAICKRCHPDHIGLWKQSNGHPANQTGCYECHSRKPESLFQDGKIIRNVRDWAVPPGYTADDPVTSQLCLDCHLAVLDRGYAVKKKVIAFNHRIHHDEGLDCISCHRTAGHAFMQNSSNRPGIRECAGCHRKEFEGPPKNLKCLNCHDVLLAPGRLLYESNYRPPSGAANPANRGKGQH